ncbi:hypothetical protein D480_0217080 [Pseudomonas aeruginosa]|nr:hypothetical protein D480_0217080 [Pseudomonas aeruginosa]
MGFYMLRKTWLVLAIVTCLLSFVLLAVALVLGFILFWAGFDEGVLSERILSFVGGGIVVVIVLAIVFSAAPLKRLNDCWRECIN